MTSPCLTTRCCKSRKHIQNLIEDVIIFVRLVHLCLHALFPCTRLGGGISLELIESEPPAVAGRDAWSLASCVCFLSPSFNHVAGSSFHGHADRHRTRAHMWNRACVHFPEYVEWPNLMMFPSGKCWSHTKKHLMKLNVHEWSGKKQIHIYMHFNLFHDSS